MTRDDQDRQTETSERLAADGLVLDRRDERATLDGAVLDLRGKPFRLLALLMAQAPGLVTKDAIIAEVWNGMSVSDAVLTTAMRELRAALGDDARNPRWVRTVHGRGYRFIPPVRPAPAATGTDAAGAHDSAPAGAARVAEAPAPPPAAEAAALSVGDRIGLRPAQMVIGSLVCLAVISIGLISLGFRGAGAPEKSVAVLSFTALSDDGDARWFADGLAEEISSALGRTPDLQVAARRAALAFDDGAATPREIGAALNVAHLVEGSVRLEDERVRVTVSLVSADTGVSRWSESYDRDFTDVLSLQGDIAARVATVLDTALDPAALEDMVRSGTDSLAAYEAYLRAQALMTEFARSGNHADWHAAAPYLERARSIDPEFAEAHALSATVFRFMNTPSLVMGPDPVTGEAYLQAYSERMDAAVAAARDPVQADVYRARRDQELFRLDEAREAYEHYLAERPNDVDRWFDYSNTLVMMGRHAEALEVVDRLDRLLPEEDLQNRAILVQHARKARDFDRASEIGLSLLASAPYHGFGLIETHTSLVLAGRVETAARINARIQESELGRFARMFADIYQACAEGDGARAIELGQRFIDEPRAVIQGYHMLRILGRDEEAYARLAPQDHPGVPDRLREMLFDPTFDPARLPHLAQAVRDAGGVVSAPAPLALHCPV